MRSAPCWAITQRVVVIPYRRFGTTYRSYLQVSRNSWVRNCYYTLRNNPEEDRAYDLNLTELTINHLLNPKQSKHFILYSTSQLNVSIFIVYSYKYRYNNTVPPFDRSSKMSCYQNPVTLTKLPQPCAKPVWSCLTPTPHYMNNHVADAIVVLREDYFAFTWVTHNVVWQ
jgi:hypothetical protein